jgi:hypothetical protein
MRRGCVRVKVRFAFAFRLGGIERGEKITRGRGEDKAAYGARAQERKMRMRMGG